MATPNTAKYKLDRKRFKFPKREFTHNDVDLYRHCLFNQFLLNKWLKSNCLFDESDEPNVIHSFEHSTPQRSIETLKMTPDARFKTYRNHAPTLSLSLTRLNIIEKLPPLSPVSPQLSPRIGKDYLGGHSGAFSPLSNHSPVIQRCDAPERLFSPTLEEQLAVAFKQLQINENTTHKTSSTQRQQTISRVKPPKSASRITPGCLAKTYPRFYYPSGKAILTKESFAKCMQEVALHFKFKARCNWLDMSHLCKAFNFPSLFKVPLFKAIYAILNPTETPTTSSTVTFDQFYEYAQRLMKTNGDLPTIFVYILSKGMRNYLVASDFISMLQDLIDTYPGLSFLKETGPSTPFHNRYIETVTARIFYTVNRRWNGRITVQELRKSNFLNTLYELDDEPNNINQFVDYFSYEHFYVIYCKFWELDTDHDLLVNRLDMTKYSSSGLSPYIVRRLFNGGVRRQASDNPTTSARTTYLTYQDFIYLLMSDEDKTTPMAIEYWFRLLDEDGDGVLSFYELEQAYDSVKQQLISNGIEPMSFTDVLCQMLDAIDHCGGPEQAKEAAHSADGARRERQRRHMHERNVRLADLKRVPKMAPYFLNPFVNWVKYFEQESRESTERQPNVESEQGDQLTPWQLFCISEYEILSNEQNLDDDVLINVDDSD